MDEPTRIDALRGLQEDDAGEEADREGLDPSLGAVVHRLRALDHVPAPDPVRMEAIRSELVGTVVPLRAAVPAGARGGTDVLVHTALDSPVRVLIVVEEPLFRRGLCSSLENKPGIEVVGEANDGAEGVRQAGQLKPDVILVDVERSQMNSIEVTRVLKRRHPQPAIIVMAMREEDDQLFDAIRAGAAAYCTQSVSEEELVDLVRRTARGEYLINENVISHPVVASRVLEQFRSLRDVDTANEGVFSPLTPRELEILRLVAEGNSNKEIARTLNTSDQTVKNHITSILRKLSVNDRTQAVIYALRHGLLSLEESGSPGARSDAIVSEARRELASAEARPDALMQRAHELASAAIADRAELERFLQEFGLEQAAYRLQVTSSAREEERRRLAREIQDGPAQVLSNAIFAIHTAEQIAKRAPEQVPEELARLRKLLKEVLANLRRFQFGLHPTILRDLGLVPTLERYVDDYSRVFVRNVRLQLLKDLPPLTDGQELAIFRIVQEALQNVHKHAGVNAEAEVFVSVRGGNLVVTIADTGRGFDRDSAEPHIAGGMGFAGMRANAELAGGDLRIESAPGQGTMIVVRVPLGGRS